MLQVLWIGAQHNLSSFIYRQTFILCVVFLLIYICALTELITWHNTKTLTIIYFILYSCSWAAVWTTVFVYFSHVKEKTEIQTQQMLTGIFGTFFFWCYTGSSGSFSQCTSCCDSSGYFLLKNVDHQPKRTKTTTSKR